MKRALLFVCLAAGFGAGCGTDHLETGYVYTPLGDNSTRRRGYYADPFSPEARAAANEQQAEAANRRAVPGQ